MQKGADQQIWPAPSIDCKDSKATSCKLDAHRIRRRVVRHTRGDYRVERHLKIGAYLNSEAGRAKRIQALFSPPIFSLAREKMGPPEARQKRPRRNESLQARLLILCARFFLSKPQTKFAVGVFLYKSATTSQALRASIPTPFVPSGHFPLIGGIGPWEGSLGINGSIRSGGRRGWRASAGSGRTARRGAPAPAPGIPAWSARSPAAQNTPRRPPARTPTRSAS